MASCSSLRNALRRRRRSRSDRSMPGQYPATPSANGTTSFPSCSGVLSGRQLLRRTGSEQLQRPGPAARLAPPCAMAVPERAQVLIAAVGAIERYGAGGRHLLDQRLVRTTHPRCERFTVLAPGLVVAQNPLDIVGQLGRRHLQTAHLASERDGACG